MKEQRRSFLKKAGSTALGLGSLPLVGAGCTKHTPHGEVPEQQWAMVVDVQKCLNEDVRQACIDACNREHNVPVIDDPKEAVDWIWTEKFPDVFPDQTHTHTAQAIKEWPILVLCNHCSRPPCTKVCPTGATWKRNDGLVMMDMHRCIGCRYCMAACPYGSRSFNFKDPHEFIARDENGELYSNYPARNIGVVEKCTFCAERIRFGRPPACVEAAAEVPGGEDALVFGDLGDPDDKVNQVLREKHTIARKLGLGTGPNVYYII